ncbi:MAG: hypothetical protein ACUVWN_03905, partial [bacterium]
MNKCLVFIIAVFFILSTNSLSIAQRGEKVAVVRGDLSASTQIMLSDLGEKVDDYQLNADFGDKLKEYWLIWVGWSNSNATVKSDFKKNRDKVLAFIKAGGAFVADTASSNMQEMYEALPGRARTNNAHSSIETAHVVAKDHKIVNDPNDITDDAFYSNWAWTAGDRYTEWEEYIVIATETSKKDSLPLWLVHKDYPVVVTTIQPTWSGHMRPKMVQNIWKYVKTW